MSEVGRKQAGGEVFSVSRAEICCKALGVRLRVVPGAHGDDTVEDAQGQ